MLLVVADVVAFVALVVPLRGRGRWVR